MSKPDLEDVDIINIVQLAARKESAEVTGESEDEIEKQIKELDFWSNSLFLL